MVSWTCVNGMTLVFTTNFMNIKYHNVNGVFEIDDLFLKFYYCSNANYDNVHSTLKVERINMLVMHESFDITQEISVVRYLIVPHK